MNVLLKPELEEFVAKKLKGGQYASASDLVNQALEVLNEQEEFTPEQEAYLRREVKRGLDQLAQGQRSDFDADRIIADERRRLGERKASS